MVYCWGRRRIFSGAVVPVNAMEHVVWILLVVTLAAVFGVLVIGVMIFARGGETNRRYMGFMLNLRVGVQAVAVLLLAVLFLLHWLKSGTH